MKPHLLNKNTKEFMGSISAEIHTFPHFLNLWHYHKELELVYIAQSTGTCFVGDSIRSFAPSTLALLGPYLPHKWQSDKAYFNSDNDLTSKAYVIHFSSDFLRTELKDIPELRSIGLLIESAQLGIWYDGNSNCKIAESMLRLTELKGFKQFVLFLEILDQLSRDTSHKYLSSPGYIKIFRDKNDRLGRVHAYVMNHFHHDISLEEVAAIAHMNKSAFCRFFKRALNKHFSQYLNEIRIGYACKLLLESEGQSISNIAYECGYNNASNFNRQFKIITGFTPSRYIQVHLHGVAPGMSV